MTRAGVARRHEVITKRQIRSMPELAADFTAAAPSAGTDLPFFPTGVPDFYPGIGPTRGFATNQEIR
jgi:hypothetical protein